MFVWGVVNLYSWFTSPPDAASLIAYKIGFAGLVGGATTGYILQWRSGPVRTKVVRDVGIAWCIAFFAVSSFIGQKEASPYTFGFTLAAAHLFAGWITASALQRPVDPLPRKTLFRIACVWALSMALPYVVGVLCVLLGLPQTIGSWVVTPLAFFVAGTIASYGTFWIILKRDAEMTRKL